MDIWSRHRAFINHWYSPFSEYAGVSEAELIRAEERLGIKLPKALREFYLLLGRRKDITSNQNCLLKPDQLLIDNDLLIFYVENQAVVRWGVRLPDMGLDDPPVMLDDYLGEVIQENDAFTEFVLQMIIHETVLTSPHSASAAINRFVSQQVEQYYERLGFPDWHWPVYPTRFNGDKDTIVIVNSTEWIWVAARHQSALNRIDQLLKVEWNTFSIS